MKFILLCLCLFCFSGCLKPSASSYSALQNNEYEQALIILAKDSAEVLSKQYLPGHTTIFVESFNEKSRFAEHLENVLRRKGFAIAEDGICLTYRIDFIEQNNVYVHIVMFDGFKFAIAYDLRADNSVLKLGTTLGAGGE